MVTFAIAGTTLSVLNGVLRVALEISRLQDVDQDLKNCLDFLVGINSDLNRAQELRIEKFAEINGASVSGERFYIDGVIERMEKGALEMGRLIVEYRVASETNDSIPISLRCMWVMKVKELFKERQAFLNTTHLSLLRVISRMETMTRPVAPPSYIEAIESMYSQALQSSSQQHLLIGKGSMVLRQSRIMKTQSEDSNILRSPSQQRALRGKGSMILGKSHVETAKLGDSHILRSPSQQRALKGKSSMILGKSHMGTTELGDSHIIRSSGQNRISQGRSCVILEVVEK